MKTLYKISKKLLALAIIFVSLLSVFATEAPAAEYKYIKIPTPPWWQTAYAYDINDSGNVVGYVWYNSNPSVEPLEKGFIFKKHIYIPLLPTGWKRAAAYRINNRGAVLGWGVDFNNTAKGFIYRCGIYKHLLPPGWQSVNNVWDINDNGAVIGSGYNGSDPSKLLFLYKDGQYIQLLPPGWHSAGPSGSMNNPYSFINKSGTVACFGYDATITGKGFIYEEGIYTELLPPGWGGAMAWGINESGLVVGTGNAPSEITKGFIYNNGEYTELLPQGWRESRAYLINNSGTVLGDGYDSAGTFKGFLYSNGTYTELLPPGWRSLLTVRDLNDNGEVTGLGYDGTTDEQGKEITKGFVYSMCTYTEMRPYEWTYVNPYRINNNGTVAGWGGNANDIQNYNQKAFIAVPK